MQRDAERELIAEGADGVQAELLWRHVGRRPSDSADLDGARAAARRAFSVHRVFGPQRACDAEVHDEDTTVVRDHHVLGLEVPVDEVGGMHRSQAAGGLPIGLQDVAPLLTRSPLIVPKCLPVDQLHGQEQPALMLSDIVHRDHVGMVDACKGLGFGEQAADASIRVVQQLDRNLPLQLGVERRVDGPHRAAPELIDDDETVQRISAAQTNTSLALGNGAATAGCGEGRVVEHRGR